MSGTDQIGQDRAPNRDPVGLPVDLGLRPPGIKHRPRPVWRRDLLLVVATTLGVTVLALARSGVGYWTDEGITVGIASRPATAIPGLLRHDGNPPAYYELLHLWMRCFGTSPSATHALSALTVAAFVPVLWWAGNQLIGRPGARIAVVLAAGCPYLAWYGAETRMYALATLLGLVAVTSFVCWLRSPSRRWWLTAVLSGAALLWVHDWGLYVVGSLAVTGLMTWVLRHRGDRRRLLALAGWGIAVLALWLPWLPSFVYQAQHTGAPWALSPGVAAVVVTPCTIVAGRAWAWIPALLILTGWRLIRSRPRTGAPSGPSGRASASGETRIGASPGTNSPTWPLAATVLVIVATGWLAGQVNSSWNERYLGVILGPFLLIVAATLARWRHRPVFVIASAMVPLVTTVASVTVSPGTDLSLKSNIAVVARSLRPQITPSTVVVASETSELPVIAHYLGPDPHYANPMGITESSMVNWVNLTRRLGRANPSTVIALLTRALPAGGRLIVIGPATWPALPSGAYNREVTEMGERSVSAALDQQQLALTESLPAPDHQVPYPVSALVFVKRPPALPRQPAGPP